MNYFASFLSSFKGYYDNINGATLTGALDVIVIRHHDNTYASSPFHVRFGKLNVLQSSEKVVDITVNDRPVNLHMKLGSNGEAFFVKPCDEDDDMPLPAELSTSPIQTDAEKLMREGLGKMGLQESSQYGGDSDSSDLYSDTDSVEYDGVQEPYHIRGDGCLSDSELVSTQHSQRTMDSESRMVWKWGNLPQDTSSVEPGPSGAPSHQGGFMSGMWEYIGRRGRKRKNTYSGTLDINDAGVFLDDIDTSDPDTVAHYFGVGGSYATRRNSGKGNQVSDSESVYRQRQQLDALSLEAPRCSRSDLIHAFERDPLSGRKVAVKGTQTKVPSKRHRRTQTDTRKEDECCHGDGLEDSVLLSLCGSQLDMFGEHRITYRDLQYRHDLLEHPDLIVQVGRQYYSWNDSPADVLAAVAFKEFRCGDMDDVLGKDLVPPRERYVGLPLGPKLTYYNDAEELDEEDGLYEGRRRSSAIGGFSGEERDRSTTYSSGGMDDTLDEDQPPHHVTRYRKTIRLTSKDIEELELKDGANIVTFSVTTSYQGTTQAHCTVYLWDYRDKIIVSDIDGTITRSDVFGHILPWVGKDWTHMNVAKLFSAIEGNGYKFLYLSSRAIGQAGMTKRFLQQIKQEGFGIPEGPVLLSPDSLLRALKTEIVLRQPHLFKTECLKDIKGLFGEDSTPFYAGFGNRWTDSVSYQAVAIPKNRIFLVNHRGEVFTENSLVQQCTYGDIYSHCEVYFPPVSREEEKLEEEFLDLNYWRDDFDHDALELLENEL